jgi:hypothetical protein
MKTSELQGAALDWAVAKCEGWDVIKLEKNFILGTAGDASDYSTDWSQGGPIIEREGISIDCVRCDGRIDGWQAMSEVADDENWDANVHYGPTPLIAAMRCFVASKLGDEVEIPEELK